MSSNAETERRAVLCQLNRLMRGVVFTKDSMEEAVAEHAAWKLRNIKILTAETTQ